MAKATLNPIQQQIAENQVKSQARKERVIAEARAAAKARAEDSRKRAREKRDRIRGGGGGSSPSTPSSTVIPFHLIEMARRKEEAWRREDIRRKKEAMEEAAREEHTRRENEEIERQRRLSLQKARMIQYKLQQDRLHVSQTMQQPRPQNRQYEIHRKLYTQRYNKEKTKVRGTLGLVFSGASGMIRRAPGFFIPATLSPPRTRKNPLSFFVPKTPPTRPTKKRKAFFSWGVEKPFKIRRKKIPSFKGS